MRPTSVMVFPGVMIGSVGGAWLLHGAGVSVGVIMGLSALAVLLLLRELQQRQPWEPDWQETPEDLRIDLLHMVLSNGSANLALKATGFAFLGWAGVAVSEAIGVPLWPAGLPLVVQVLLAMVAGELLFYTAHRAAHTHPVLWRYHAVHHCSERLTVLSAGRNHPINAVVSYLAQVGPAIALGAGEEVLLLLSVFTTSHGMLQHANIPQAVGPLNRIFATVDLHRWHHSADPVEGNTNYGSNLMLWDHLLGTFVLPPKQGPQAVGIDAVIIPESYRAHLLAPFVWTRLERRIEEPEQPPLEGPGDGEAPADKSVTQRWQVGL